MKVQVPPPARADRADARRSPRRRRSAPAEGRTATAWIAAPRSVPVRRYPSAIRRAIRARSDRLVEQLLDRSRMGIAGRAADFLLALEHDQRALHAYIELLQQVLLRIEVDSEARQVLEARVVFQFREDRRLRLA